jgi:hypothetical protein
VSGELPEIVRLRGGGFAWRERDLPPFDQFRKELAELDEVFHERGARERFLAKRLRGAFPATFTTLGVAKLALKLALVQARQSV